MLFSRATVFNVCTKKSHRSRESVSLSHLLGSIKHKFLQDSIEHIAHSSSDFTCHVHEAQNPHTQDSVLGVREQHYH